MYFYALFSSLYSWEMLWCFPFLLSPPAGSSCPPSSCQSHWKWPLNFSPCQRPDLHRCQKLSVLVWFSAQFGLLSPAARSDSLWCSHDPDRHESGVEPLAPLLTGLRIAITAAHSIVTAVGGYFGDIVGVCFFPHTFELWPLFTKCTFNHIWCSTCQWWHLFHDCHHSSDCKSSLCKHVHLVLMSTVWKK